MQVHLLAQGYEVWEIVEQGFTLIQDEQGKKYMVYDAKAKDLIISGLIESVYLKVLSCKTAKEVWGKLENIYAGTVLLGSRSERGERERKWEGERHFQKLLVWE